MAAGDWFGPPPMEDEYAAHWRRVAERARLEKIRARAERARIRARTGLASVPRPQVKRPPLVHRRIIGRIRKWISFRK